MVDQVRFAVEDGVAVITLDRREKFSAFTDAMPERWIALLERCRTDRAARVVAMTGAGRAFTIGRDTEGTRRIHEQSLRGTHEPNRVPVGRFGSRTEIVAAVAHLVSPAGRDAEGTDLVVDGGRRFRFCKAGERL